MIKLKQGGSIAPAKPVFDIMISLQEALNIHLPGCSYVQPEYGALILRAMCYVDQLNKLRTSKKILSNILMFDLADITQL